MHRFALACLCVVAFLGCKLEREPSGNNQVSGLSSAVFRVGPEGASRSFEDGSAINIPPGALGDTVLVGFRATDPENEALPQLPPGLKAVSAIYACTPHGQTFDMPVELTLPHHADDYLDAVTLRLSGPEDQEWDWIDMTAPGQRMTEFAAYISTSTFSYYVVAEPIAGATCGNGVPENGEVCDDGVNDGAYGNCDPGCQSRAAYCGDGEINIAEGEICDPPESCDEPDVCEMTQGCNGVRYEGSPETCDGRCVGQSVVMACEDDDGCCPDGCEGQDSDCIACGNGRLEAGESCEAGTDQECPTDCDDGVRCTVDLLVNAGTCNAYCMHQAITVLDDADGCCPPDGTSETDLDCGGGCGDGVVDTAAGETCEEGVGAGCPTSCDDDNPCTRDLRSGSAANCNAACTITNITQPIEGDACCPQGQTANTDGDCVSMCGNGAVEPGETCEPGAGEGCPVSCESDDECVVARLTGDEDMCTLACTETVIRTPQSGDGCCPTGADSSMDSDCTAVCGNGVIDPGEMCDPRAGAGCADEESCNDGIACTADIYMGSAAECSAVCTHQVVTNLVDGDGCCPAGANADSDEDCSAVCGNGIVEGAEQCEPGVGDGCPVRVADCPAMADACRPARLVGAGCTAECVYPTITVFEDGDGCCPAGASANDDGDCEPECGNGVVEEGEVCDGNCPTSCDDGAACTADTLVGSARTCSARCEFTEILLPDGEGGDGCCPARGNANTDSDCSASCGNGVREGNEVCDGNCPTLADCNDGVACTADSLSGSAAGCSAVCVNEPITTVGAADGCCPDGANANNDGDCDPFCGNGVRESGEDCDGASCPTSCNDEEPCTTDALLGTAAACTARCTTTRITSELDGDGCCPDGSVLHSADDDCPLACNDGVIDTAAGETCDSLVGDGCPTSCDDGNACTADMLVGSAEECTAACLHSTITGMVTGDGCCPAGATANSDGDCEPVCGNGVIEEGETCDGDCPSEANPCENDNADSCVVFEIINEGVPCRATCRESAVAPDPENEDGCCPSGLNNNQDADCLPDCGNGVIERGETCDGSCVCRAECAARETDCQRVSFTGSCDVDECTTRCTVTPITSPSDNDGCCPDGATASNDNDCVGCGNGVVEGDESCDGDCPTAASCDDEDPCTKNELQGSAASCTAECSFSEVDPSGTTRDSCCPAGTENYEDIDCPSVCGNGELELGELCDPAASGPDSCPNPDDPEGSCARADAACLVPVVVGNSQCQLECDYVAREPSGEVSDQCCPEGTGNANNDVDCLAVCGDGVKEGNETCDTALDVEDPDGCPACRIGQRGCTVFGETGVETCQHVCVTSTITRVANEDGCCPVSGNANNDSDCEPSCGNGVVEPAGDETCDNGSERTSCENLIRCPEGCLEGADGCFAFCSGRDECVVCGDGFVTGDERCDPNSEVASEACPTAESCKEQGLELLVPFEDRCASFCGSLDAQ